VGEKNAYCLKTLKMQFSVEDGRKSHLTHVTEGREGVCLSLLFWDYTLIHTKEGFGNVKKAQRKKTSGSACPGGHRKWKKLDKEGENGVKCIQITTKKLLTEEKDAELEAARWSWS